MANDVVKFNITDGKLAVEVDPNKNGKPVLSLLIDLAEVPSEVLSVFQPKKD